MARQIAYDPLAVRHDMLQLFWADGYAGTSLKDIERATGLDRRQLYNGLGDKRAMFLQALDDFHEIAGRRFLAPLEAESSGVEDISNLLRTFVELAGSEEGANGCLVCSTSQEEIAADEAVKNRIDRYFDRIEAAYRNALTRAFERGETALPEHKIEPVTALLFGVHVSLCVLGRAGQSQDRLRNMVEEAIEAIG